MDDVQDRSESARIIVRLADCGIWILVVIGLLELQFSTLVQDFN